jgi:hypothetical protein
MGKNKSSLGRSIRELDPEEKRMKDKIDAKDKAHQD